MKKLYNSSPDGYCGDEDNGQTSAWYVFSALGFYPVTPGTNQYVFGSPIFERATLTFENGRKLRIIAQGNSSENVYIKKISLEGKVVSRNYVQHHELTSGGRLIFYMEKNPAKNRGTEGSAIPFSMSDKGKD
jgi:putative alpha-1,2-mannosidase